MTTNEDKLLEAIKEIIFIIHDGSMSDDEKMEEIGLLAEDTYLLAKGDKIMERESTESILSYLSGVRFYDIRPKREDVLSVLKLHNRAKELNLVLSPVKDAGKYGYMHNTRITKESKDIGEFFIF